MTNETWVAALPNWAYFKHMHDAQIASQGEIPERLKFSLTLLDEALKVLVEIEKHADENGTIKFA